MIVDIVSPSGRVFNGEATRVKAPGVEGSFEVLKNHAPMIAAIEVGTIVVTGFDGNPITIATSGGFVEVQNNTVSVVAETAELASEIDVERAKAAEQRAVEALANADPQVKATMEAALERARNRVRVAMGSVGTSR
ncbi:MAG: ATP synthase F1 subunit epsilon [Bacteroidetes bacterium]|jgi:F-type H+-transporting ATPase subunit epsilon|nr:ATP synthase F1 subunit epsilon [Bacteroidota bacterium]